MLRIIGCCYLCKTTCTVVAVYNYIDVTNNASFGIGSLYSHTCETAFRLTQSITQHIIELIHLTRFYELTQNSLTLTISRLGVELKLKDSNMRPATELIVLIGKCRDMKQMSSNCCRNIRVIYSI